MANPPPAPREVQDACHAFPAGVNMGISPLLLEKDQLASGTNITVRGTLVQQRPPFQLITITPGYPSGALTAFQTGKYQGGCYFKPDNGFESLMFQIGGRLFLVTPGSTTASILDVTVPGNPNPTGPNQAFLWQTEKWVIVNDGVSVPIFFDQTASPMSRRSTWNTQIPQATTVTTAFVAPAVGALASAVKVGSTGVGSGVMVAGTVLTLSNAGTWLIQTVNSTTSVDLVNLTGVAGKTVPVGTIVTWQTTSTELPPGVMGAYVMGQNWFALPSLRQFTASDQVGDSSGTVGNNFRDAVLNISRNLYLVGGGNFAVPGTSGEITAFTFVPTLDVSLGQGPLQVLTPNTVFSCNVPTDPLTWQTTTNPILPPSMISYGGLGQWSTVLDNSDVIMRSVLGITSLLLARRDFNKWGVTPISREVEPIVAADPQSLLPFASAIVFDNRLLMTAQPVVGPQGVYWQQIVALNNDPISSLRGKAPSVYDGTWTGLNVLQLFKGQFSGVERAFAICYNALLQVIELYEIYKTIPIPSSAPLQINQGYFDNGTKRIVSVWQMAVMLKEAPGKSVFDLVRLIDGEVYFDNIRQTTDVQVWYRPDSYPCWIPWTKFSICAPMATDDPMAQPGYRTRIGLGEPSGAPCDEGNNRPLRTGYWFQCRVVQTGPGRFLGMRVKAVIEPQTQYAKPAGCCENDSVLPLQ